MISHNVKVYKKVKVFRRKLIPLSLRVDFWDIQLAHEYVKKINKAGNTNYAYGFKFEVWRSIITDNNGEHTVTSELMEASPIYYVDAFVETQEDIRARLRLSKNRDEVDLGLLKIMEEHQWMKIVRGIKFNWVKPLEDNEIVL